MKNRKTLLFAVALVVAGGCFTTWAISRASSKPKPVNTRYLEAFFHRYVASLSSKNVSEMMSFYTPDAVTGMAWGKEMNNAERAAYYAGCVQAFPQAVIEIKKAVFEPITETSGNVTWDFGIKSGPQMAPFLGVYKKVESARTGNKIYDQEGVSTGQIVAIDKASVGAIKGLEEQIAALDKKILSLDEEIAALNPEISSEKGGPSQGDSSPAATRFGLAEKRSDLAAERALLDQRLLDQAVASMKFVRQSSFQNMDGFLKKISGK